jgi:hypothetical protein
MANQNEKDRRKNFLNRKSRNSICSRFNARTRAFVVTVE